MVAACSNWFGSCMSSFSAMLVRVSASSFCATSAGPQAPSTAPVSPPGEAARLRLSLKNARTNKKHTSFFKAIKAGGRIGAQK